MPPEPPRTDPTSPRRRRPLRGVLIRLPLTLLLAAVGALGVLAILEPRLVYPRDAIRAPRPDATPGAGGERWALDAATGRVDRLQAGEALGPRVEAWFLPAPPSTIDPATNAAPLVVFFHGNAELIDDNTDVASAFNRKGLHTLLIEYPGYGRSAGSPSQRSITSAANAFIEAARNDPRVRPEAVILHGRSLGGGVAAQVAASMSRGTTPPPAALILESTFTGIDDLAAELFVPRWLVRNSYRTRDVLRTLDVPVLIIHGTYDTVIPFAHALRNARIAGPRATLVELATDHNDLGTASLHLWVGIQMFLSQHTPTPALPPLPPPTPDATGTPDG